MEPRGWQTREILVGDTSSSLSGLAFLLEVKEPHDPDSLAPSWAP